MIRTFVVVCGLGLVVACTSARLDSPPAQGPEDRPASDAREGPPVLRLPEGVAPTAYRVDLEIDPDDSAFAGAVEIDLAIAEPTDVIWLNATELEIEEAELRRGETRLDLAVRPGNEHVVGFELDEPLAAGEATLAIAYRGPIRRGEGRGVFVETEAGTPYQFTQFQATDARKAFPCFDEPRFKVPWTLAITAPQGQMALANTPAVGQAEREGGAVTYTFAETEPLPSYLIAFAVGPFDVLEAGESRDGTPMRIVTPAGRAEHGAYAAEATAELLAVLEDYTGSAYPYAKLDSIAMPRATGFTAMEHPGLITFDQDAILWSEEQATLRNQRRFAYVQAHELAHQWFGNLVTPAWWDDLWLNESFATWAGMKTLTAFAPEWEPQVGVVQRRLRAMKEDSLASARKIREPIESYDDISNAFDGITYAKGQSILFMVERWVGKDTFRDGVRAYLAEHASGVATYDDFVRAVSEASGRDLEPVFRGFLEQVGVPVVSFALSCEPAEAPKLRLSQRRYLPLGSEADPDPTWRVPVCVRYPRAGGEPGRACTLLEGRERSLSLEDAGSCPRWLVPNDGGLGYYTSELDAELARRLATSGDGDLSRAERLSVAGDIRDMVRSGSMPIAEVFEVADALLASGDRYVAGVLIGLIRGARPLVPDEHLGAYRALVRELLSERARELGWQPRDGESLDAREARALLVEAAARLGQDEALIAAARERATRWLDHREGLHASVVRPALRVAAAHGDAAFFERLVEGAVAEERRRHQRALLEALGHVRERELAQRALSLILDSPLDTREALRIVDGLASDERTRELAYAWVKDNWSALEQALPTASVAGLSRVGAGFCTEKARRDVKAFFQGRSTEHEGGPRILAQSLESIALCSAFRNEQRDSAAGFFAEPR